MIYLKAKYKANKMSVKKDKNFYVIKRNLKWRRMNTWFGLNYTYVSDWYLNKKGIKDIVYTAKS